jgi:hypothetical protein
MATSAPSTIESCGFSYCLHCGTLTAALGACVYFSTSAIPRWLGKRPAITCQCRHSEPSTAGVF